MPLLPEILLVCLLLFLYCLFVLAKDDFILLRKNISLEQLFSATFGVFLFGLLFSRIFYVFEHVSKRFLDPLVFFIFPYFPGLSLAGGMLGGMLILWYISTRKNFPFGRILDIATASFFISFPFGMFFFALVNSISTKKIDFISFGVSFVFFLFSFLYMRVFLKTALRDGSIGFLGLAVFSLLHAVVLVLEKGKQFLNIVPEEAIFFVAAFLFLALFIQQEKLSTLLKGGKRK